MEEVLPEVLDYDDASLDEEVESEQAMETNSDQQETETLGAEACTTIECRCVQGRGSICVFGTYMGSDINPKIFQKSNRGLIQHDFEMGSL